MTKNHVANTAEHSQGEPDARVTLTEYGDYQCSYCAKADDLVKALQKDLGPALRFVFRNFPLQEIHPDALNAAAFAEAAAEQGAFWPFHDSLIQHQEDLSDEAIFSYARELGLDVTRMTADARSSTVAARIDRDINHGEQDGVQGTPPFLINGKIHEGAWDFESLRVAIKRAARTASQNRERLPSSSTLD